MNSLSVSILSLGLSLAATSLLADDTPLGGIRLLEGYKHVPLQGFDSVLGRIEKEGGLAIQYEVGRIALPGRPQIGGSFSDRPKAQPKNELQWYREQTINHQSVHIAYRKDKLLLISFPENGINFSAKISSTNEMADALLMILTYPDSGRKKREG